MISSSRTELLKKLMAQQGLAPGRTESIPRRSSDQTLAPSFSQQRLWALEQLTATAGAYHVAETIQLQGQVDVSVLTAAFQTILARHEGLRCAFRDNQGQPLLIIDEAAPLSIQHREAFDLDEEAIQTYLEQETLRPFDLEQAPLIRVSLLTVKEDTHLLTLVMHHLISDAWSLAITVRELAALYTAFLQKKPNPLPPLTIQYGDYAAWQARELGPEKLGRLTSFWSNYLKDLPELTPLPTDFPRPPVQTHRGANLPIRVPDREYAELLAFGRRHDCTLFVTLQAIFTILLHRYTQVDDLVLGTPHAGRHRPELEPLVGFLVNTLVLRQTVDSSTSFRAHVEEVKRRTLDAFEHLEMPFDRLVDTVNPRRNLAYHPLFQVMFIVQNAPASELRLPGLELQLLPKRQRTSKFDLLLEFYEQDGELNGQFDYNTDLFTRETIEQMTGHFLKLITDLMDNPEQALNQVALLSQSEHQMLKASWQQEPLLEPSILPAILRGLQSYHDRIAYHFEGRTWTYREIDRLSNGIATMLQERGLGKGDLVPILMTRNWQVPISLLGIMKSGAAFVPMDGTWPEARICTLLDQLEAPLVLLDDCSNLPPNRPEDGIVVTADAWDTEAVPTPISFTNEDLIYCIFTSGSTGTPKGALNFHQGIANRFQWMTGYFQPQSADVIMQTTHHVFDSMVWQFFWPLTFGGSTVIPAQRAVFDLQALINDLERNHVTITDFVPSELDVLVDYLSHEETAKSRLNRLRALIVGGEAMNLAAIKRWLSWYPDHRITNLYGPTECSIATVYHTVTAAQKEPVPIGQPLPNTAALVLNPHGQVQPVGVAGELVLGGLCVGRGYLNQPDKTAQVFIDSPAPELLPGKLYRTGDLARLNRQGQIEYLGRIDHQFKLRGYRIESGEIEVVLTAFPGIESAAVILRDLHGAPRIVAYYRLSATAIDDDALRAFVKTKLPDYMVPSQFEAVDAFPLTAGGKLDRAALQNHPLKGVTSEQACADAASNHSRLPVPQRLADKVRSIWLEILEREEVGFHDNFFDVGGHSLLLVKLQTRLRDRFGHSFSAVDLFEAATIASQATLLRSKLAIEQAFSTVPSLDQAPTQRPSPQPFAGDREVAIVGMAIKAPGAKNLREFWEHLLSGQEGITRFSEEDLRARGVADEQLQDPRFVPAGGILEQTDRFDAGFFGIAPSEAETMDPQQRLMLELAWHALEHAGYGPGQTNENPDGSVGVFVGSGMNTYLLGHLLANRDRLAERGLLSAAIANEKDFLATRIAYKLNLKGPAVSVQTACSTSASAIHQAARALREGSCDLALAGGISIDTFQDRGYLFQEDGIQSPDGHCRPFDEQAAGTVGASGAGLVVLKSLANAKADGDQIWAVLKGGAITNDGAQKAGFTAPSIQGQERVLSLALADAGLEAADLSFIEAHGTGTALGDPIECQALNRVFRDQPADSIALGSLKSNIGHLNSAAGVASVIKATLALHHRVLPATLHFHRANPRLKLEEGPFFVNQANLPLSPSRPNQPIRAGVSSFGIGGTNVHLVLESAAKSPASECDIIPRIIPISAATDRAIHALSAEMIHHFRLHRHDSFGPMVYSLAQGRNRFSRRCFIMAASQEEAQRQLIHKPVTITNAEDPETLPPFAFLFPGQGAQSLGMAYTLYRDIPAVRTHLDEALRVLNDVCGMDLQAQLIDDPALSTSITHTLESTDLAQPALFAVGYAVARGLIALGAQPAVLMGHSVGEWVAATLAGVVTLAEGLRIVHRRGTLMSTMPAGAMVSVACSAEKAKPYCQPGRQNDLVVAAVNGPSRVVFAGSHTAIEAFTDRLNEDGLAFTRLRTSHAFHSPAMEDAVEPFRSFLQDITLRPPKLPFISNLTGTWITNEQATSPDYWCHQLRHTVQWASGLRTLTQQGPYQYVDCGPSQTLAALFQQNLPLESTESGGQPVVLSCMPRPQRAEATVHPFLITIARLWQQGYTITWNALFEPEARCRVPAPSYPFQRQSFWVPAGGAPLNNSKLKSDLARLPLEQWCSLSGWQPAPITRAKTGQEDALWVVWSDDVSLANNILTKAKTAGLHCRVILTQPDSEALPGVDYADPGDPQSCRNLVERHLSQPDQPYHLLYAMGLSTTVMDQETPPKVEPVFATRLATAFDGLRHLIAALAHSGVPQIKRLLVVTRGAQWLPGDRPIDLATAPLLGLARVIPLEFPDLPTRMIDLDPSEEVAEHGDQLCREMTEPANGVAILWRRGFRQREQWFPLSLPLEEEPSAQVNHAEGELKQGGTYVITGGLGWIGLALARYLVDRYQANLILIGRSALTPSEPPSPGEADPNAVARYEKWCRLRDLQTEDSRILVLTADLGDRADCHAALDDALSAFGSLDGFFHLAGAVEQASARAIAELTQADCEAQFRAKVWGTIYLDEWLARHPGPDFCLLFSSLSAVLGGLGFGAYAAANRFLDSFAYAAGQRSRNSGHLTRFQSINWDGWHTSPGTEADTAITPAEAWPLLEACLACRDTPVFVVATTDLHTRNQRWHVRQEEDRQGSRQITDNRHQTVGSQLKQPERTAPFRAPITDLETTIADIWRTLFGFASIGLDDHFLELGGDSLMATQYFSHLRARTGVHLPLASLFDAPTLAEQAALAAIQSTQDQAVPTAEDQEEERVEEVI